MSIYVFRLGIYITIYTHTGTSELHNKWINQGSKFSWQEDETNSPVDLLDWEQTICHHMCLSWEMLFHVQKQPPSQYSTIVLSVNVGHTLLLQETPLFIIGESYNLWNSLNAYCTYSF